MPRRRFRRRARTPWIVLAIVAVLLAARAFDQARRPAVPEAVTEGPCRVERVIDGDTLLLVGGARLRLIGADAPETVRPDHPIEPWGPEAAEFTHAFVAQGPVDLRLDRERRDQHGRFLGYVYVGGRMLNEELIRAGLARARLEFNYADAMKRRFRRAEDEARAARRGLWSADRAAAAPPEAG